MQIERHDFRSFLLTLKEEGCSFCFAGEESKPKDCVITFDDGYADNYQVAFPLMEELNIPMTLFLNTDWIGTNQLRWSDEVATRVSDPIKARELAWKGYHRDPYEALEALARESGLQSQDTKVGLRGLRLDEVKELAKSKWVRLEAHGHAHRVHRSLNEDHLREDTCVNLDRIESLTGRRPTSYAYPFGRMSDLTPFSLKILEEFGIASAYLAEGRKNFPWTHPLLRDRETVH